MPGTDSLEIEILEDGTIKASTDTVSPANHLLADKFMKYIAELAGGKVTRTRKGHVHSKKHEHEFEKH